MGLGRVREMEGEAGGWWGRGVATPLFFSVGSSFQLPILSTLQERG